MDTSALTGDYDTRFPSYRYLGFVFVTILLAISAYSDEGMREWEVQTPISYVYVDNVFEVDGGLSWKQNSANHAVPIALKYKEHECG